MSDPLIINSVFSTSPDTAGSLPSKYSAKFDIPSPSSSALASPVSELLDAHKS